MPARIDLLDQYEKARNLQFPTKKVTVLAVADRHGADEMGRWIKGSFKHHQDQAIFFGVADCDGTPGFLKGRIVKRIRAKRPESVALDWSGEVAAAIGYVPKVANVIVVSKDGTVLKRITGAATKENMAALADAIQKANAGG